MSDTPVLVEHAGAELSETTHVADRVILKGESSGRIDSWGCETFKSVGDPSRGSSAGIDGTMPLIARLQA